MEKDVNDRVMDLIAHFGIQPKTFAERCDIPPSTISRISHKKSHPNFETLSKIISTFEDLNSDWLMTGKGNMMKTNNPYKEVESLVRVVQEKDEQLYVLKRLLHKIDEVESLKNNQTGVSKAELGATYTQELKK